MKLYVYRYLLGIGVLASIWCGTAQADAFEESLQLPTDGAGQSMFPLNPAYIKPKDLRTAVIGRRNSRRSVLDHSGEGGTKIDATVSEDGAGVAFGLDLGAGAGIAVDELVNYRLLRATIDNRSDQDPKREVTKSFQTSLKLIVELTSELRGAIVMRYLQDSNVMLGEPFLPQERTTRYGAAMLGYGCGLAYTLKEVGFGYTYYPPLHGKTAISGQDLIVIEPGLIALDGYWQPSGSRFTLGLLAKRWIIEADDLAAGSTASDNKTRISYYGLDPDQYIVRTQLLMLGANFNFSSDLALRFGLGEEQGHFDFRNRQVFDGAGVQQQGLDPVTTLRARASLHAALGRGDLDIGFGYFTRSYKFGQNEGGGRYDTTGREMSLAGGLHW